MLAGLLPLLLAASGGAPQRTLRFGVETRSLPSGIAASEAYYQWGLLVAARADDKRIRTTADLAGLKVGHFADPVVVQALTEMGAGLDAHLVSAEDGTELFKLLRAGAVDAVIFDSPGAGGA